MAGTPNPLFDAAPFNSALFGGVGQSGLLQPRQVGPGILYPALRKAQVTIGPQRTPSPAQFQDAIDELNRLIGSLNCDRLNIYSISSYQFPLTGQKSYTIGQSPDPFQTVDFAAPRPQKIERANIVSNQTPAVRYPLAIATDLQWARIRVQDQPNSIPTVLYNDRGYPLSTLYLWGQPIAGYLLELFTWLLVPGFQAITDVVLLPPGYEDALTLNLAVRLAPHFQRDAVPPDVREDARKSLMRLESINAPRPMADTSAGLGCGCDGFNIYKG